MDKDENLLRIKINGRSLIKLSKQHKGRDFIISYPITFQNNTEAQTHFTLHTPNDRVTFKITSLKQKGVETMPNVLALVRDHPVYVKKVTPTDLDLYGGEKIIDLSNPEEISYAGTIALNMQKNSIDQFFRPAKTPDNKFKSVKDINIPNDKEGKITIKFGFGKNFKGDLIKWSFKYPEHIVLQEKNFNGDEYIIVFFIEYSFPEIDNQNRN